MAEEAASMIQRLPIFQNESWYECKEDVKRIEAVRERRK